MSPYDEDKARALGLERTTRELTDEVRRLAIGLDEVSTLRLAQQRTRRMLGTLAIASVAALLCVVAIVSTLLLVRVNNLIDERRSTVQRACIARNQESDDRRERFAKLAMQDNKNGDIWAEMARSLGADAVDCSKI